MTALKARIRIFNKYKPLLYELVFKDIKVKYRGSILGLFWSVLQPLLNMVVITVVFSTLFAGHGIENYPVYYLSGSLIFALNQDASAEAMTSIIYNAGLLRKIYVPKYLFPLSKVVTALANCSFSMIAMFIIMLITGAPFHWTLVFLPLLLAYVCLFSTGLGLFLAGLTVRFRDIQYFYTVFLMAWTYLTPIFYPVSILPGFMQRLENLNPMFHFVNYSRNIILYGQVPSLTLNLFCLVGGVLMLSLGIYVFRKLQDTFVFYI